MCNDEGRQPLKGSKKAELRKKSDQPQPTQSSGEKVNSFLGVIAFLQRAPKNHGPRKWRVTQEIPEKSPKWSPDKM